MMEYSARLELDDHMFRVDLEIMRMLWVFHWVSPHQLARLVMDSASRRSRERLNKILARLYAAHKIWREPKYTNRAATDNTEHFNGETSGGYFYGLTDSGQALMADLAPTYMPELLQSHCMTREFYLSMASRKALRHSAHYTEFCTRFICEMRHHRLTVGLFLDTESTRLGSHLRMDGLLRHRFWRQHPTVNASREEVMPWHIPWLHGLRTVGDPLVVDRTYAVEIDEGTEELEIIMRKAQNYQRTFVGGMEIEGLPQVPWATILCPAGERLPPNIRQTYFPLPVFVVPGPQRLANVWAAWQAGWPGSGFRATHWGLLNVAKSVMHAPYLSHDGAWVNLIGQPHAYQGRLPQPRRLSGKVTGRPA